jgi:hypothetical protein
MKAIIVLLAVTMALVGAAAAWDSTNNLQYTYTKTVNTQAGENLPFFFTPATGTGPTAKPTDASSSAQFTGAGAYGTENGFVGNSIADLIAVLQPVIYGTASVKPDTHDVLTQYGSATVATTSPDLQTNNVIKSGTATAGENMALSGNYGGAEGNIVQALFNNVAAVGIDGVNVETAPVLKATGDYPTTSDKDPLFSSQIEAESGFIVDANLGQSANVGFQKMAAIGAVPTMSGGVNNWASFSGAYGLTNANGVYSMPTDIEASVANEQGFSMVGAFPTVTPASAFTF